MVIVPRCTAILMGRFSFEQAVEAFETTKLGKSPDGRGVIKAVISGPGVNTKDV